MSGRDIKNQIKGYQELVREAEVCRKYGRDYEAEKGLYARYLDRLHPRRLQLKVNKIIVETSSTKTFRMVGNGTALPPFQAGQYINLNVKIDGVRTSRAYSISSPPTQTAYYDITVRRIANGFVSDYLLDQVTVGDSFESGGPTGNFYYNPLFHGNNLVFIAGGSGITPFMSMIRETVDSGSARQITLIYGSKTTDDIIFHSELTDYAASCPNFEYYPVISEPEDSYQGLRGFIDAALLRILIPDPEVPTFYLCGPQALYELCTSELIELGVPQRQIRKEVTGSPADITAVPGWPDGILASSSFNVKISGGLIADRNITVQAGEPL
ncbi:MAG: ferredoxin reductase, partial [Methylocystaceae bacterium]